MTGKLLVGCRGWNHDQWTPGFYPAELPDDWRFCFYSNEIRSVLIPFGDIFNADLLQWREDCDAAFRFVFECPVDSSAMAASAHELQQLIRHIQPVVDRTAAILISDAGGAEYSVSEFGRLLEVTSGVPLCVDLSKFANKDQWAAAFSRLEVGQVWRYPCVPSLPIKGFQVSLAEDAELPALRKILESLSAHAQCGAGVFFTDPNKALRMVRQARTMVEIMGI